MISLSSKRHRVPGTPNSLRAPHVVIGLLFPLVPLVGGCQKVCSDDGFGWQQDPSCLAMLSITETATETVTDTDTTLGASATEASATMNPTMGGGGLWCADKDGDGFGDPAECTDVPPGQTPPDGTVNNEGDCDDSSGTTFPGSAPNDDPDACMADADGDDWGDADPPPGGGGGSGAVPGTDCDDASMDTFPGSAPNDDPDACMTDADGDDWGDANPPGGGGVVPGTDCNDADVNAWMSCMGCKDDDGDGWLSECDAYPPDHPGPDCDDADPKTFPGSAPKDDPDACMKDADDDDWGDNAPMNPGVMPGTDCDDESATTFPGAASADDPDACMQDEDGDGHGDAKPMGPGVMPGSDCYDSNPDLNPANNVLLTAPINTGDVSTVDTVSGAVTKFASVDVKNFVPWIPTSLAVNPVDGSVYAALAFRDRLVTMDYCGMGMPTALPMPHKKNICGIAFDRNGMLYGIDGQVDQLLLFSADGSIAPGNAKPLTFEGKTLNVADCGMAYDCHADRLVVSDSASGGIYAINPADGTTTKVADLPNEIFGSGLEYDPKTKQALSCDQTSFLSIALDGSNTFKKLKDLATAVDDLLYGPKCN